MREAPLNPIQPPGVAGADRVGVASAQRLPSESVARESAPARIASGYRSATAMRRARGRVTAMRRARGRAGETATLRARVRAGAEKSPHLALRRREEGRKGRRAEGIWGSFEAMDRPRMRTASALNRDLEQRKPSHPQIFRPSALPVPSPWPREASALNRDADAPRAAQTVPSPNLPPFRSSCAIPMAQNGPVLD
jgi:hypothetical protein